MTDVTYTIEAGKTLYIGRFPEVVVPPVVAPPTPVIPATQDITVPAWVPPTGFFADIPMLNNPEDVKPAIYKADGDAMNNPFIIWGGSAILSDFSPLGAQVYYSGGHEATYSNPNIQYSLICDFSTLKWSVANTPIAANVANTFLATGYTSDGTPYCPHTYLGLQEFPTAWGGGKQGTLLSLGFAGSSWDNKINLLDVSQPVGGYSVMNTNQSQNIDPTKIRFSSKTAGAGSYPITSIDAERQGYWMSTTGSIEYLLFVSKTGAITQYPALGGNLANGVVVLCDSLQLLIAVDGGYESGKGFRTVYVRNIDTGVTTVSSTAGAVPSLTFGYDGSSTPNFHRPDVIGLQWVEEMGCLVGLDQNQTTPTVVTLTPEKGNAEKGVWTWGTVPVTHWPSDTNGSPVIRSCMNGYWSKFRYVKSIKAFVVGTGKVVKPQVIKLF